MSRRTHVCTHPGCPELAPCPEHQRQPGERWDDRDMASHMRFARAVRKRDRVCQSCGASENLVAHHTIAGHDDPSFGVLLCRACHQRVDPMARPSVARRRPEV